MEFAEIDEQEKNLEYIENEFYHLFNFKIRGKPLLEAWYDYDKAKQRGEYIQALQISDGFKKEFENALTESKYLVQLRKESFNNIKLLMKYNRYNRKEDKKEKEVVEEEVENDKM